MAIFGKPISDVEARKKAKASREARLAKSKAKSDERKAARAKKREARKASRAEKKAGKKWTKAVKKQKKTGGPSMTELIKRRNAAEKGSSEYASAQNQINKAYGSKKVHKAAPAKEVVRGDAETAQKITDTAAPPKETKTQYEKMAERKGLKPSFAKGGKVNSNAGYNWPTRDARSGFGKKK